MHADYRTTGTPSGDPRERASRRPVQSDRTADASSSDPAEIAAILECEITGLRRKMVEAYLECDSLTSDLVMEISRKLDVKINEYMKATRD